MTYAKPLEIIDKNGIMIIESGEKVTKEDDFMFYFEKMLCTLGRPSPLAKTGGAP
jgi:hypothetical protein